MKYLLCLLAVSFANLASATYLSDQFNPQLIDLYKALSMKANHSDIVGRHYTVTLNLRHASERHLIFNDAFVNVSDKQKYQIAKWQFQPEKIAAVSGKSNIECRVVFIVRSVENSGLNASMPFVVAEIIAVNAQ